MSKRNGEGDVLSNVVAVGETRQQSLLRSLLGGEIETGREQEIASGEHDDEDLKGDADDEKFGVGASIPKDIGDGSFVHRMQTSDDKLLQQLIGKKAAKAHLAAKQASRNDVEQLKYSKPQSTLAKEGSEDEEEGRASAFQSKKRKTTKPKPVEAETDKLNVPNEPLSIPNHRKQDGSSIENVSQKPETLEDNNDGQDTRENDPKVLHSRPRPASYLDQLLAERSRKKKKKLNKTEMRT